ncbi:iron-containing redox enzyme family protein [Pseudomonas sp. NA-150]|uniref:iron-containing redox enzyme family protein n=1 Tax=Pseudomonas sp. NA-150 TaxID=3367525 RepID=UPI0037C668F1
MTSHQATTNPFSSSPATGSDLANPATSSHDLCRQLLDIEHDFFASLERAKHHALQQHSETRARSFYQISDFDFFIFRPEGFVASLLGQIETYDYGNLNPMPIDNSSVAKWVLTQYAPQGLLLGSLLQNFCNPGNAHEKIAAIVHGIHATQVGMGDLEQNHALLFRQMAESIGVQLPAICSEQFSRHLDLLPSSSNLSAYRLSLSLFAQEFDAEILGALLFEVSNGLPAIVRATQAPIAICGGSSRFFQVQAAHQQTLIAQASLAIETYLHEAGMTSPFINRADISIAYSRILDGFMTSARLHLQWTAELGALIQQGYLDPLNEMVRLVQRKGPYAVGYHPRLNLAQRPFDEAIVGDALTFVEELAKTRWISPGDPEASLLLSKLIAFGGPMFRIFSDSEVTIIRNWITALPAINAAKSTRPDATPESRAPTAPVLPERPWVSRRPANHIVRKRREPVSARTLYFKLLNSERYPDARNDAGEFAATWLARSVVGLHRDEQAIAFTDYSHLQLRSWFEERARHQASTYVGPAGVIEKTREDVIDEAIQLCPMILIDGAWLQKWGNAGLVDTRLGTLLFKIFSDELGNGDPRLNHPNIYRQLMAQMEVELPEFRSREFAQWSGFTDEAFEVPAFWLSLSQFPRRFLPETLGLNLAMELSGVGGGYRTAHDELRHYGFSTLFVDLHNTIDNASTGHSALALDAIEQYMDEVLHSGDSARIAERWQRIWTGFRALSPRPKYWRERFKRLTYPY